MNWAKFALDGLIEGISKFQEKDLSLDKGKCKCITGSIIILQAFYLKHIFICLPNFPTKELVLPYIQYLESKRINQVLKKIKKLRGFDSDKVKLIKEEIEYNFKDDSDVEPVEQDLKVEIAEIRKDLTRMESTAMEILNKENNMMEVLNKIWFEIHDIKKKIEVGCSKTSQYDKKEDVTIRGFSANFSGRRKPEEFEIGCDLTDGIGTNNNHHISRKPEEFEIGGVLMDGIGTNNNHHISRNMKAKVEHNVMEESLREPNNEKQHNLAATLNKEAKNMQVPKLFKGEESEEFQCRIDEMVGDYEHRQCWGDKKIFHTPSKFTCCEHDQTKKHEKDVQQGSVCSISQPEPLIKGHSRVEKRETLHNTTELKKGHLCLSPFTNDNSPKKKRKRKTKYDSLKWTVKSSEVDSVEILENPMEEVYEYTLLSNKNEISSMLLLTY